MIIALSVLAVLVSVWGIVAVKLYTHHFSLGYDSRDERFDSIKLAIHLAVFEDWRSMVRCLAWPFALFDAWGEPRPHAGRSILVLGAWGRQFEHVYQQERTVMRAIFYFQRCQYRIWLWNSIPSLKYRGWLVSHPVSLKRDGNSDLCVYPSRVSDHVAFRRQFNMVANTLVGNYAASQILKGEKVDTVLI